MRGRRPSSWIFYPRSASLVMRYLLTMQLSPAPPASSHSQQVPSSPAPPSCSADFPLPLAPLPRSTAHYHTSTRTLEGNKKQKHSEGRQTCCRQVESTCARRPGVAGQPGLVQGHGRDKVGADGAARDGRDTCGCAARLLWRCFRGAEPLGACEGAVQGQHWAAAARLC